MPDTNYDIFISFKDRNDDSTRTWASEKGEHIYHTLISKGYHPFYSRKSMECMTGEQVSPVIDHALSTAKVMILVFSSPWEINSKWVRYEWGEFMRMNKPIIIVFQGMKSEDLGKLQPELADTQGFDLTEEVGNHTYNRIIDAVERLYSQSGQPVAFRDEPRRPSFSLKKSAKVIQLMTKVMKRLPKPTRILQNTVLVLSIIFYCFSSDAIAHNRLGWYSDLFAKLKELLPVKLIISINGTVVNIVIPVIFCGITVLMLLATGRMHRIPVCVYVPATTGSLLIQLFYVFVFWRHSPGISLVLEQSTWFFGTCLLSVFIAVFYCELLKLLESSATWISYFTSGIVISTVMTGFSLFLLLPRNWGCYPMMVINLILMAVALIFYFYPQMRDINIFSIK